MSGNEENGSFYRDANEGEGEHYQLEDPMTYWNAEKKTFWKKISGRTETPFVLMGMGLVLVIAVFFAFLLRGKGGAGGLDSDALSDRIRGIEEKVGSMEAAVEDFSTLQEDVESIKKAVLRLDNADASMSARVQRLAEDLTSVQKEMAGIEKSLSNGARALSPSPGTEKAQTVSQAVYHEVAKGDTLYSIGRRYGVGVDVIRKLNGLSGRDSIHPGQKLKVKE
jgi:LysM repeat protein